MQSAPASLSRRTDQCSSRSPSAPPSRCSPTPWRLRADGSGFGWWAVAHLGGSWRAVQPSHDPVGQPGGPGPGTKGSRVVVARYGPASSQLTSGAGPMNGHRRIVLLILDILMMRWIIATFDRERVVASSL